MCILAKIHLLYASGPCGGQPRGLVHEALRPAHNLLRNSGRGVAPIPYVGQATDEVARLFHDRGMTTHILPYHTIRATLVQPKDKPSMEEQRGVVYQITCTNCPAYVGETERPLSKRRKEHQRPGSPVSDHLVENNHSFAMDDVVMKHREKDWFRRGLANRSTSPQNVRR